MRIAVAPPTEGAEPVALPAERTTLPAPPATATKQRVPWWVVPLLIVGTVVIAFLVLMGMPFGGDDNDRRPAAAAKTETIAEADPVPSSAPVQTGTVIDVSGEEPPPELLAPTQTAAPVQPAPRRSQPRVVTQPPPSRPAPVARTQPPANVPERPVETPRPTPETAEVNVSEAMSSVRAYVTSRDYYSVGADCIGVGSLGYQNVGYTLEVRDSCNRRTLGRWRVDAKTGEIFRQRDDGRYLRP